MSDVLNNAEKIASDVATGATLVERVASLETSHAALQDRVDDVVTAPAAALPDGFDKAVALINTYGPMLEELAEVAHKAKSQGHTFSSIFGSIGSQLLGIFLHSTADTTDAGKTKIGGGAIHY